MDNPRQTVLIVDDQPANIHILSEALGPDFESIFATSGQQAIDTAVDQIPDLILLDIIMPGMDGYEVCRRLKAIPEARDIPVIFVTARDQEEDEAKGLDCGAIDYLIKPVRPAIVRARVRNHLDLRKAEKEREKVVRELKEALARIKTLSGLLPICASCKKIRDDQGYWTQMEAYIRDHSEAEFSHSICPECVKKLYPEFDLEQD